MFNDLVHSKVEKQRKILSLHLLSDYLLIKAILTLRDMKGPHNVRIYHQLSVLTSFRTWTASILNLIWDSNHRTKVDIYIVVCSFKMYLFKASARSVVNLPTSWELPLMLGISRWMWNKQLFAVYHIFCICFNLTGKVVFIVHKRRTYFSRLLFVYVK